MQILYDFIPILIFFVIYKFVGIYAATLSAIIMSFIQTLIYRLRHRRFDPMQIITFFVILLLGGATILSRNPLFIKWKPTVVNWIFALLFLGSQLFSKKTLLQYMMDKKITLPDSIWRKINISWCLFFIITGALNLYVAYHYSTNTWVNFKLFGLFGLTLAFAIGESIYLSRFLQNEEA